MPKITKFLGLTYGTGISGRPTTYCSNVGRVCEIFHAQIIVQIYARIYRQQFQSRLLTEAFI